MESINSAFEAVVSQVGFPENERVPFCYSCYKEVPSGLCPRCGSDDLMTLFPQSGCDYELWRYLTKQFKNNISPIDVHRAFEDYVRETYTEEFKLGWMVLDTVECMKVMDPCSWMVEMDQWLMQNIGEGVFVSFDRGKTYYSRSDLLNGCHSEESIDYGSEIEFRSTVDEAKSNVINEPIKKIQKDLNI